ncbi:MAG TPA: YfhO family protein, partial [bacterium]|nr:YfhO family protein [bacterium]
IPELGNYSALCMYCGALPLLLAFYGAVFGRMRARLFFAAAGILALLLALGTPLTALFSVIPGLNMIDSHRILFLYTFAVPVLAGIGWEAIEKKSGARAPGVWALFGVFAASAILFALWAAKAGVGSSGPGAGVIMKLALPAFAGLALMLLKKPALRIRWAAAVVIIFLDLVLWAGWYAPTTPKKYLFPETPSTLLLEQDRGLFRIHGVGDDWLLLPNTAMQYGLNDIRGIESLYPERYFHLINAVSGRKFGIINDRRNVLEIFGHDSPFVDMINVKYIFSTDPITEPGNEQYAELMKEDMRVTLNRGAFPRFYGVRAAYVMDSPLSVLKAVSAPDFNPAAGILLDRENSGLEPGFYPQDASAGMIALDIAGLDYRPGDIGFSVTAPEACWLASSEPQDPGWLAYIDGEPAQVFTANYHFRAVRLPGGKHSVEFRYRPRTVHAGAVSALAACLLLLLWIFAGKRLPASRHKGRF